MNKRDLVQMDLESRRFLRYTPIEGVIRWSTGESWKHYLAKCIIVRQLKEGVPPSALNYTWHRVFGKYGISLDNSADKIVIKLHTKKLKKWEKPKIYTEARFGRVTADVFVSASVDGRAVIEIAGSEEDESLEKKEREYKKSFLGKLGIKMYVVRV